MRFDLVDCWDDLRFAEKCFEACSCEIGNADCANFASGEKLLHSCVCCSWVDWREIENAILCEWEQLPVRSIEGSG